MWTEVYSETKSEVEEETEIYYNLENLSLKFLLKLMTSNQIGTEFVLIKIEEKLS